VLERTKAIYDWTVENMYRDPDTIGCGLGDVNALLKRRGHGVARHKNRSTMVRSSPYNF
jgi:hypothetical protein